MLEDIRAKLRVVDDLTFTISDLRDMLTELRSIPEGQRMILMFNLDPVRNDRGVTRRIDISEHRELLGLFIRAKEDQLSKLELKLTKLNKQFDERYN